MKKIVQTSITASLAFFLSAGISFGAELDDLDVTIRVVESDDITKMHNELSLPDMISVDEPEHAGQMVEAEHDSRPEDNDEARDEHEDELEDHDEAREDRNDVDDERDEATEEEKHEEDHEQVNQ